MYEVLDECTFASPKSFLIGKQNVQEFCFRRQRNYCFSRLSNYWEKHRCNGIKFKLWGEISKYGVKNTHYYCNKRKKIIPL
jgi:hypothetical protein